VYYRKSEKFSKDEKAGSDVNMAILQELLKNPQSWKFNWFSDTPVVPYYTLKDPTDTTLIFESRFDSGNLDLAIKVDDGYYKLIMQNDSNTKGNCQWFYFKVSNTKQKSTTHFEIMNFVYTVI
jgi:Cytosolic carboxypeptidase N-terminal domain